MRVDYLDHMGSDLTVVNAARVSFDKRHSEFEKGDGGLIDYLARHGHWTPFGHCQLQLRVAAPVFVARQLVKHQVGLVWNEVSRRYVATPPEFYWPGEWRGKPVGGAKQGSAGRFENEAVTQKLFGAAEAALSAYEEAIEAGMAPEQARMILPQNMMTQWYWTGSLMAFARVCRLRLDPSTQAETRQIAQMISKIAEKHFPLSWKALMASH